MKNFALIGAASNIAPRHMQAIRDTGNKLVAAYDPNDPVGAIDSYFPEADFFTEFERFDRHLDQMRRATHPQRADYVAICSPNYLHDSHMRFAMRSGADAICEKPLVLNPWNIDGLREIEQDTGRKVNTLLPLRLHPAILALREKARGSKRAAKHEVDLAYVTSRDHWDLQSWNDDTRKAGATVTHIGVHLFDMLHFIFGELQQNVVHQLSETKAGGYLEYEHARVRWFLSVELGDVPAAQRLAGRRSYRSVAVDGKEIEFSGGFTGLHTRSYQEILAGRGFGLEDNRCAITTVSDIRHAAPIGRRGEYHPLFTRKAG